MARTATRADMRTAAQRLSDRESDTHISTDEWDDWLDDGIAELWGHVSRVNPDWYVTDTTINGVAGTQEYTLPADFLSVRRVDRVENGWYTQISPAPMQELDWNTTGNTYPGAVNYIVIRSGLDGSGARLALLPDPGTYDYRLLYVQAPQRFTADTGAGGTFDGVAGWERYAIYDAACAAKEKSDEDSTPLRRKQAQILQMILAQASRRDQNRPGRIADVRASDSRRARLPLP